MAVVPGIAAEIDHTRDTRVSSLERRRGRVNSLAGHLPHWPTHLTIYTVRYIDSG